MYIGFLERIARSLDERNIRYMVIGGQAVVLYGEPRLTKDIDITLGTDPSMLPYIIDVCSELGLHIAPTNPDEFVKETYVLPADDPVTGFSVKFIFSDSRYEQEALSRAASFVVRDYHVKYATAEDVIIHKVIANRPRDEEDIRSILRRTPGMNQEYILGWLKEFDTGLHTNYVRKYEDLWADSVNL